MICLGFSDKKKEEKKWIGQTDEHKHRNIYKISSNGLDKACIWLRNKVMIVDRFISETFLVSVDQNGHTSQTKLGFYFMKPYGVKA